MSERRYSLIEREKPLRRYHERLWERQRWRQLAAVHHPDRGFNSMGSSLEDGSGSVSVDQLGGGYHRHSTLRTYDFGPGGRLIRIRRQDPYRD